MGKKLAIRGHSTRGKEVIELLEMLGGVNDREYIGTNTWKDEYYTLDNGYIRVYDWSDDIKFTLEEFLEKYPYKVGDKVIDCYGNPVTIKSMKWSDDFETIVYDFVETEDVLCAEDIESVNDTGLKIENINMTKETITPTPDISAEVTDKNNCDIQCPDGYAFYDENGNLIGTKVMMRPKKPKYPDNYEECVRIAKNIHGYDIHIDAPAYRELLESFVKLLICRDAYWRIAGEEMGLGKSWEPDWKNGEQKKYCIYYSGGDIQKGTWCQHNSILAFPTEEMRDVFYENFKDLIEQCKELL